MTKPWKTMRGGLSGFNKGRGHPVKRPVRRGLQMLLCVMLAALWVPTGHAEEAATDRGFVRRKPAAPKPSEQRVALVVGNWNYRVAPLRNPASDSRDIAQALRELGFDVTYRTNIDRKTFRQVIREFGDRIRRGGTGLFYYAGHGMQAGGHNYLVPVGADIQQEDEIPDEALEADMVLRKMRSAGNRLNIVILDACRNNPFARSFRSGGTGLARMDAPKGTLISYATAPGSVASDGKGENSPFTHHLLQEMRRPGVPVEQVFKRVRQGVLKATKDKQTPWEASSLTGDFYFTPAKPGAATLQTQAPALSTASSPQTARAPHAGDLWKDRATGMAFVWVPGGCFEMGRKEGELDAHFIHEVCVDGFWMGQHEVTRGAWQQVMKKSPPGNKAGDQHPVENISWLDSQRFITQMNQVGQDRYRLPTETEWEYACRSAGKDPGVASRTLLASLGWTAEDQGRTAHQVATKQPNAIGLYDMNGNVWEWVQDNFAADGYQKHQVRNPLLKGSTDAFVVRGGAWDDMLGLAQCGYRYWHSQNYQDDNVGLRLVRTSGR